MVSAIALASACASVQDAAYREQEWTAGWPEKKCIRADTGGVLPASFDTVARYLNRPALVQRLQGEYRRRVSKDKAPDFSVIDNGDGSYCCIDENRRRTDLVELYRRQTSNSTYDLAYHAAGKGFFGKYEVVVRIRLIRADPAGTLYTASVSAYPHSGPMRFLARRLGVAERYLQRKARIISLVSERICRGIADPLPLNPLLHSLAAVQ